MSSQIVFIQGTNDEPMVSSREVAEKFGKQHKDVLESARSIMSSIDETFSRRNFEPTKYTDSFGRSQPEILMTKNGFSLLAMGFTGSDALRWKIQFLNAFDSLVENVLKLKQELERKEQVIQQLQGKKQKRERRWLAPVYEQRLDGFPDEPRFELRPRNEIKEPDFSITKMNHILKIMEGLQRQVNELQRKAGMYQRKFL